MTVDEMVKIIKLNLYNYLYKKEVEKEKDAELFEAIDQARECLLIYRIALIHLLRPKNDDIINRNN